MTAATGIKTKTRTATKTTAPADKAITTGRSNRVGTTRGPGRQLCKAPGRRAHNRGHGRTGPTILTKRKNSGQTGITKTAPITAIVAANRETRDETGNKYIQGPGFIGAYWLLCGMRQGQHHY